MEKNLPSMNPLLKIWMPSFSSHILMPHGKEDSMKTPMDSSDNTSRKKLNSTISRISKSSRWWKNSITVQENAWEWKHQINYSSRIIHLSHFGVESAGENTMNKKRWTFWPRSRPAGPNPLKDPIKFQTEAGCICCCTTTDRSIDGPTIGSADSSRTRCRSH